ncbi:unnamed protein product [Victoria cruziana]
MLKFIRKGFVQNPSSSPRRRPSLPPLPHLCHRLTAASHSITAVSSPSPQFLRLSSESHAQAIFIAAVASPLAFSSSPPTSSLSLPGLPLLQARCRLLCLSVLLRPIVGRSASMFYSAPSGDRYGCCRSIIIRSACFSVLLKRSPPAQLPLFCLCSFLCSTQVVATPAASSA